MPHPARHPVKPPPLPASEPAATAFSSLPRPWEPSTVRLGKAECLLLQSLGDGTPAQACLIQYEGEEAGQRWPLDGRRMLLGRSGDCEVCIEHASISRCHAELTREDGQWVLRDRGSSNGTRVNQTLLQGSVPLADGDVIRLGHVALKFFAHQSLDALLHDRIYRLATVDAGTEVFTRRYLLDALAREIKRARRSKSPLSLICLDLDNFKAVNDRFGHEAGDRVLRHTATLARAMVRTSDILGRMGGEEFAVILPDTPLGPAVELAERVRSALAAQMLPLELLDEQGSRTVVHRQTASFGVAELVAEVPDARALLAIADRLLYAAKHGGRNCVQS